MTTGPFEVLTKHGLQPRTFVSAKMRSVTCSMGVGSLPAGYWVAVRPPSTPRTWPVTKAGGIRAEEHDRPGHVVGVADAAERDAGHDAGLEGGVVEQHRHLGRVHEGGADGVDADAVLGPLGRPLAGQRADGALRGHVGGVAGVDAERRPAPS